MKRFQFSLCSALSWAMLVLSVTAADAHAGQEVLRQSFDGLTVAVAEGPAMQFTVALTDATSARQLQLPPLADTISEVRRWNNRLTVIGAIHDASVVYVVGLETATVLDTFIGALVAVSPDGRFVAYARAVPRSDPATKLYLVYDLSLSPELNRMASTFGTGASVIFCGTAVFPVWNHDARSYEPNPSSSAFHELRSPIRWLDTTTLAFLDYAAPTISAVVISLRNGLGAPEVRSQSLDAMAIVDRRKLELAATDPLDQVIVASDIVLIRSTPTTWVIEIVIQGGAYVKQWTVDIEM